MIIIAYGITPLNIHTMKQPVKMHGHRSHLNVVSNYTTSNE